MKVEVVAWTHFAPPADVPWETDADGGQALVEFAGRACYQSWDKPNPATATNAGFLRHLLEVGHLSVLEHASATFWLTGISQSLSQELVRHRHFSFSQLSPRHDPQGVVVPAAVADDPELARVFDEAVQAAQASYTTLLDGLERVAASAAQRKQARQAARAVLPLASETRLVVTGNYRAMRHFVAMRASDPVDAEMRALAIGVLRELQRVAPHAFADFVISPLDDGTEVAASPLVGEG